MRRFAGKQTFDWRGKPFSPSLRQIQRRCAAFEREQSISALSRRARSDRGKSRCFISREWDRAVSGRFDDEIKAEIADGLRQQVRGLVKGGATGKIVAVLACEYLKKVTVANGIHPDDPGELGRICKVPRALIRSEQHLKKVYRHKNDRKASDDDRPRVKRAITDMQPMDCVVMDVHHINVLLKRQNGTTGTPKLLGFMDIATRRVWCELVFIETRGGVRNVDVIEAFVAMAQHSAFGLPKTLYCDNGKEYLFADFLDDAMQLLVPNVGEPGKSRVIRALPYNAAAKPIEAWFGHFEQQFLKTCPGYIGDDRMNPKRPAPGKLPTPFTGDFAGFKRVFKGLLKAYEVIPQSGALKGLSPSQSFEAHVRQGWAATVIDPDRLNTVFTKPETRKVRQHGISVGGRRWSCDELDAWFHDTVTVHIPQYHGYNALRLTKPDGSLLGIAHPEEEFAFFDPRGARRSAERNTRRNRALRNADRSAPDIDIGAELVKLAHRVPEAVPNVPRGTITVTQELEHQQALRPEYAEPCSESEDERDRREIAAARDTFIRTIGRN
ncbi:MAG: Mu transposase C-terminal domain-containing protein [Roseibium sp.]